jgi:hypothetical protein
MNQRLHISGYVLLAALLLPAVAVAQGARLKLDQLSRLADKADDTVDINVDTAMLKLATGFLVNKNADAAKLQQLIADITGIYIKSFEFKGTGGYTDADVESVRKQLANSRWSRIVSVRERDELTEIYFFREKDEDGGLVLIAAEPTELTIVNIVGRVDLATLATLAPIIPKLPGAIGKELPKR